MDTCYLNQKTILEILDKHNEERQRVKIDTHWIN